MEGILTGAVLGWLAGAACGAVVATALKQRELDRAREELEWLRLRLRDAAAEMDAGPPCERVPLEPGDRPPEVTK